VRKLDLADIPEEDLRYSFSRSGGPGGQNVNKVSTRVTLWFNLGETGILTEAQKHRVRERFPSRVTRQGELRIAVQRHRSQSANREEAGKRLIDILNQALVEKPKRKKTRIPAAEKKRRLEEKKHRSELKKRRSVRSSKRDWDSHF